MACWGNRPSSPGLSDVAITQSHPNPSNLSPLSMASCSLEPTRWPWINSLCCLFLTRLVHFSDAPESNTELLTVENADERGNPGDRDDNSGDGIVPPPPSPRPDIMDAALAMIYTPSVLSLLERGRWLSKRGLIVSMRVKLAQILTSFKV